MAKFVIAGIINDYNNFKIKKIILIYNLIRKIKLHVLCKG